MTRRLRAMCCAVFALVVGVLAYLLGVWSFLGQQAEASVLDASAFTTDPPAPLSLVSVASVIVSLVVIGLVALWVHGIGRAVTIMLISAIAIVASQLLKESWLDRPQLFELDASNTFPSGHMTVFAVLAGGLIWALPKRAALLTVIMSALVLGIVSWQLLEYGWHRPSDLLGAQALAVLAFSIAAWIGPRGSRRGDSAGSGVFGAITRVLLVIVLLIGILLVLGGLVLVWIAASTRSSELMLNAGEICAIGVSIITARMLAALAP